jgi:hypothetical protein
MAQVRIELRRFMQGNLMLVSEAFGESKKHRSPGLRGQASRGCMYGATTFLQRVGWRRCVSLRLRASTGETTWHGADLKR